MKKAMKGQLLVEILVAATLLVLVLVAVTGLMVQSIYTSRQSRDKALATRYGQEVIEWLRAYRDWMGWGAFYTAISDDDSDGSEVVVYCLGDVLDPPPASDDFAPFENLAEGVAGNCSPGGTFTREVEISLGAGSTTAEDALSVLVTVWWDDDQYSINLRSRFSKWD